MHFWPSQAEGRNLQTRQGEPRDQVPPGEPHVLSMYHRGHALLWKGAARLGKHIHFTAFLNTRPLREAGGTGCVCLRCPVRTPSPGPTVESRPRPPFPDSILYSKRICLPRFLSTQKPQWQESNTPFALSQCAACLVSGSGQDAQTRSGMRAGVRVWDWARPRPGRCMAG